MISRMTPGSEVPTHSEIVYYPETIDQVEAWVNAGHELPKLPISEMPVEQVLALTKPIRDALKSVGVPFVIQGSYAVVLQNIFPELQDQKIEVNDIDFLVPQNMSEKVNLALAPFLWRKFRPNTAEENQKSRYGNRYRSNELGYLAVKKIAENGNPTWYFLGDVMSNVRILLPPANESSEAREVLLHDLPDLPDRFERVVRTGLMGSGRETQDVPTEQILTSDGEVIHAVSAGIISEKHAQDPDRSSKEDVKKTDLIRRVHQSQTSQRK